MILTIDISPAEEASLATAALTQGISLQDYARHILRDAASTNGNGTQTSLMASRLDMRHTEPPRKKTYEELHEEATKAFIASGVTEEEVEEFGSQLIKQMRAEMRLIEGTL